MRKLESSKPSNSERKIIIRKRFVYVKSATKKMMKSRKKYSPGYLRIP